MYKNLSKKFHSLFLSITILLTGGGLGALLTSCDNFLADNNLDEKIKAAIDYANSPYSTFVVSADTSAGTIIPSGHVQYKPTDLQNIEFTLKPSHSFIKWRFSYKRNSEGSGAKEEIITDENWWKDYITIKNQSVSEPNAKGEITYQLQIQFDKVQENLLIEPVCSIKPELKSWLGDKGEIQSRNASLSFQFNTAIDTTASIFYTESEINAIQGAQALKNGLGEIYGYTKGGETFFKNVEIFYKKRNINSSYGDFRYKKDSNTLIISPDTNNSFEIADDFAEIQVVFKSGIKNPDGAALTESSAYVNINKYSDEHSIINTYTNTSQTPATVTLAQQNLYLLEKKMISFTETEDTQFLYWDISSHSEYPDSVDKIATEINPETPEKITFWGKSKISSEEEVTVSAVYKYRPKITEFLPKDNEGVKPKDSDIEITFDAAVNLASFKNGYKILCNGNDVTGNFKTPYIKNAPDAEAGTSIIIEADAQNRLDIDTGSIKTISIVIPKDLYYQVAATDGKTYNITLGKDITKNFKIDNSTRTKAYIKFNLANNAGHAEDKIDISTPKTFNIGESVTFTVIENSDWQFTGWTKNGDANNAIEIVKSDDDYKTYTFKIKGACGSANSPFIINAVCKERPKVKQTYPAYNAAGVPKDTDIELYFSKKPDLASCKDKITITCNNISVEENFPAVWMDYKYRS